MTEPECAGCGRAGRVPAALAGARLACRACGLERMAPGPAPADVQAARRLAAVDAAPAVIAGGAGGVA